MIHSNFIYKHNLYTPCTYVIVHNIHVCMLIIPAVVRVLNIISTKCYPVSIVPTLSGNTFQNLSHPTCLCACMVLSMHEYVACAPMCEPVYVFVCVYVCVCVCVCVYVYAHNIYSAYYTVCVIYKHYRHAINHVLHPSLLL